MKEKRFKKLGTKHALFLKKRRFEENSERTGG